MRSSQPSIAQKPTPVHQPPPSNVYYPPTPAYQHNNEANQSKKKDEVSPSRIPAQVSQVPVEREEP